MYKPQIKYIKVSLFVKINQQWDQERSKEFFLSGGGGAQNPFGPENPLKSIGFTGPGGGLASIAPPWNTPLKGTIPCKGLDPGKGPEESVPSYF